jgi:hypothetical protein
LELSGGNRRRARRSRSGALVVGAIAVVLLSIAGCGDDSESDAGEASGTYRASVVEADFPASQQLGETTLMRLAIRNDGDRTIPAVVVNVSLGGEEGSGSSLPFGVRSGEPGLAQPERPVWVLSEHYPKIGGSADPGGTEGATPKSFNFGPLRPGRTVEGVWKLSAVKAGDYRVLYGIDAGVSGEGRAETAAGKPVAGSFAVKITDEVPDSTVNDRGEVVQIQEPKGAAG